MARMIAVFSNGHRDEYKGHRDVKAGWMVTYPNGGIESGHSLDRTKAMKTASGNISHSNPHSIYGLNVRRAMTAGQMHYYAKMAREAGFENVRALKADAVNKSAAFRSACKIEIVDLVEA